MLLSTCRDVRCLQGRMLRGKVMNGRCVFAQWVARRLWAKDHLVVHFHARSLDEFFHNEAVMPTFSQDDYISRSSHRWAGQSGELWAGDERVWIIFLDSANRGESCSVHFNISIQLRPTLWIKISAPTCERSRFIQWVEFFLQACLEFLLESLCLSHDHQYLSRVNIRSKPCSRLNLALCATMLVFCLPHSPHCVFVAVFALWLRAHACERHCVCAFVTPDKLTLPSSGSSPCSSQTSVALSR